MKAKIITDNPSLLLGFRLGGISGELISDKENISENFKRITRDQEVALIIFTKSCYDYVKEEIENFRLQFSRPLIVVLD